MTYMLEDGTGKGNLAKVDSDNRLLTRTVQRDVKSNVSVADGKAFNINTGIITLTSGSKSALLYVKNNETTDSIIIESFIYLFGNTTGGSGDSLVTILRNPTTGTIVSGASAAEMAGVNRNFASTRTITADIYKGAEGNTFTNGDKIIESIYSNSASRSAISAGDIVLAPGNSIGVEYTPPASNTSQQVEIAISCHLEAV